MDKKDVQIAQAALKLAARQGWENISLDAIARAAKTTPAKIKARAADKNAVAALIVGATIAEALPNATSTKGSRHDRLFEVLMARFDVLQQNRAGSLVLARAARRDAKLATALGKANLDAAYTCVDHAGLDLLPRPVAALGVSAAFGWAFCAWARDESRDMGKTMAALDRALRLGDRAVAAATRLRARGQA